MGLGGIIIVILELRNLIKARQKDLVVNLYTAFNTMQLQEADMKVLYGKYKDYDGYVEKHSSFASQKPIRIDRSVQVAQATRVHLFSNGTLLD